MQKNVASQKLIVFAFDSTTNLPKTGDSANLTAYVSKDYGAITVLADTTATEMDSTNAKGYYLFDLAQAETNADTLLFTAKSSTANIVVVAVPATVFTTAPNFSLASIDSNGRVDVINIAGTPQTARDLGASVLLSPGTGTGQISLSSGGVTLADGVSHGGTLGSSTATLALSRMSVISQTSNTSAITATGNGTGSGVSCSSGAGATGNGITSTANSTNGNGLQLAGSGTGSGVITTGGGTGHGLRAVGGGTSGDGISAAATTSGSGLSATGAGTTKPGIIATGGATTSAGLSLVGGGTSGDGLLIATTSGHGVNVTATGASKHGVLITGGDSGTADGLKLVAGTGGVGFRLDTLTASGAVTLSSTLTVTGATTLTGAVTASNASNNIVGIDVAKAAGTAWGSGAITTATFAAGAIDAAAIATGAIDADALAADAVTEIWAKAMTELSAVPGVTGTVLEALSWVFSLARNKIAQTSTTQTVYKDDGSTTLAASTVSDDGTTFTRGEFA